MRASHLWTRFKTWWHGACLGFGLGMSVAVVAIEAARPWRMWLFIVMPLCWLAAYIPVAITQSVQGVQRFRAAAR